MFFRIIFCLLPISVFSCAILSPMKNPSKEQQKGLRQTPVVACQPCRIAPDFLTSKNTHRSSSFIDKSQSITDIQSFEKATDSAIFSILEETWLVRRDSAVWQILQTERDTMNCIDSLQAIGITYLLFPQISATGDFIVSVGFRTITPEADTSYTIKTYSSTLDVTRCATPFTTKNMNSSDNVDVCFLESVCNATRRMVTRF
ncbi:MAG: hypothetical protein JW795_01665 [Chitinivibrionales bacterium]|nr:hypothetical protein [Chitinivibrionales bacterium]